MKPVKVTGVDVQNGQPVQLPRNMAVPGRFESVIIARDGSQYRIVSSAWSGSKHLSLSLQKVSQC